MKRFDPGLEAARDFIDDEMGELLALKAWYCDSTHRYAMTDAVQPLIVTSASARKPAGNPKADLRRYFMLAHGSHLVDTARFLGGEIVAVDARLREKFGAYCWFVDVEFANGALGHLDLTVAVRMDWHEGFQIYGENGSVLGKTYNPWYLQDERGRDFPRDATRRDAAPLGADGHFYRRQVEGFADTILNGAPMRGATSTTASPRCARWSPSPARSRAASGSRSPTSRARSDEARHLRQDVSRRRPARRARGRARRRLSPRPVQHGLLRLRRPCRTRCRRTAVDGDPRGRRDDAGVALAAISGTYNMIHPDPRRARRRPGAGSARHRPPRATMGTRLLTLCTGTRDPDDQWRNHPTTTPRRLARPARAEIARAIAIAERHDVDLGIEPEQANVVTSAARRASG